MTFNKVRMTFTNLDAEQKVRLKAVCEEIAIKGKIDWDNEFVRAWMHEFATNSDQELLLISTVFPVRALFSIIDEEDL